VPAFFAVLVAGCGGGSSSNGGAAAVPTATAAADLGAVEEAVAAKSEARSATVAATAAGKPNPAAVAPRAAIASRITDAALHPANAACLRATKMAKAVHAALPACAAPPPSSPESVMYSFHAVTGGGYAPAPLVLGPDGFTYYGTTDNGGVAGMGTVYSVVFSGNQATISPVYDFGIKEYDARSPQSALTVGSDGFLYGMTAFGGTNGGGTIYRIDLSNSPAREEVIYNFAASGSALPSEPDGVLLQDTTLSTPTSLVFYGTTQYVAGSSGPSGTVFEVTVSINATTKVVQGASAFTLHQFDASRTGSPLQPTGTLVQDSSGNVYGTTYEGGTYGAGAVFQVKYTPPSSATYRVIHNFGHDGDGVQPNAGLVIANSTSPVVLWGTTEAGGGNNTGSVFKMTVTNPGASQTVTESVIYDFDTSSSGNPTVPVGGLVMDASGNLYGTGSQGGEGTFGGIFELQPGTPYVLHNLHNFGRYLGDGATPTAGVVLGSQSGGSVVLYGTTDASMVTTTSATGLGSVYQITVDPTAGTGSSCLEYVFNAGYISNDGFGSMAQPIEDSSHNFWGTTEFGGTTGEGTVWELVYDSGTSSYSERVVYSFGTATNDGLLPASSLVFGNDGNLYGTTQAGGSIGAGAVFKITVGTGEVKTVYSFGTNSGDGSIPNTGLVLGSDGNFYGTTSYGGANNTGIVYQINSSTFDETILASFGMQYLVPAYYPNSVLLPYAAGTSSSTLTFLGTSGGGGPQGEGTVYGVSFAIPVTANSATLTNLHGFGATSSDGYDPTGGVILGTDGNYYGVTSSGGVNDSGTVFALQVTLSGSSLVGTELQFYSFESFSTAGAAHIPMGGLVSAGGGVYYGTTEIGGANSTGTVFEIQVTGSGPSYAESIVYSFRSSATSDVREPMTGVYLGQNGNLYGTTFQGGQYDSGGIFRIQP
jgi:uncharacterized repeat protein (TIGR03803 family)